MASYRASSSAFATPSSSANVVVCHSRVVPSFELGWINRSAIRCGPEWALGMPETPDRL